MKLQIPAQHIELTGKVQRCLLIAEQQGFSISDIELGVSPTHAFQFHSNDSIFQLCLKPELPNLSHDECLITAILDYQSEESISEIKYEVALCSVSINIGVSHGNQTVDYWIDQKACYAIDVTNNLSSVIAFSDAYESEHLAWLISALCLDFPLEDALVLARACCSCQALVGANVSRETWPYHRKYYPNPILESEELGIKSIVPFPIGSKAITQVCFPKIEKNSLGLYPVVDTVEWIERLLKLGIKTVQLRIKDEEQTDLEQQVEKSIHLGRQYDAQVFINDHWQLAIKYQAFGVHLGQEDIQSASLQLLSDANIRLGLSTHSYYELLRVSQLAPSYIALGHIFPTTTKQMPSKPQGLVRLKLYQMLIDSIAHDDQNVGFPTVAIGGIDNITAPLVWKTGVSSLAVVRGITLASDPKQAIEELENVIYFDSACSEEVSVC